MSAPRTRWANRWALVPVALLAMSVTSAAIMVSLARGDGHGADAEPDYYRKAIQWDELRQQRARNEALGWVVTPRVCAAQEDAGAARIEVVVADKHAVEVVGASVSAEIVPIRAGDARVSLGLAAMGGGRYGADVPVRVGGQWAIRVRVESKDRVWADEFRRQVNLAPPPGVAAR